MDRCLQCGAPIFFDDYWSDHGYCMYCAELIYEDEQDEY